MAKTKLVAPTPEEAVAKLFPGRDPRHFLFRATGNPMFALEAVRVARATSDAAMLDWVLDEWLLPAARDIVEQGRDPVEALGLKPGAGKGSGRPQGYLPPNPSTLQLAADSDEFSLMLYVDCLFILRSRDDITSEDALFHVVAAQVSDVSPATVRRAYTRWNKQYRES